ncbi:hypothetical protein L3Q82_003121 [Scortum barcoo]|uniref:Uncharacterized protein n=1 Tax=Scortum barcoo TaxID=214431 RepID=A0ACB8VR84_9TELE|nr:hypothetical protein L3Q82_003121 [Scortum barcoo]
MRDKEQSVQAEVSMGTDERHKGSVSERAATRDAGNADGRGSRPCQASPSSSFEALPLNCDPSSRSAKAFWGDVAAANQHQGELLHPAVVMGNAPVVQLALDGRADRPSARLDPHHGLRAATEREPSSQRPGRGRQAEAEAPVEASRAGVVGGGGGEPPHVLHAAPVSSMPSSKAKSSDSIKRGASPGGGRGGNMTTSRDYSVNLSVQQVLSLWVQGTTLQHFTEMWYWVFLWCLFSSLFVHGAVGLLMLVMLQRHKRGRLITLVLVSVGFLASLSGGVITSAAVAGVYRVAGKGMAPLEALVFGVGQTTLSIVISFSRILATL